MSCCIRRRSSIDAIPDSEFINHEHNGIFSVFQSLLDELRPTNLLNFITERKRDNIYKRFKSYLYEGIDKFYLNLMSGNLEDFEVNSIDSLFSMVIIIGWYGPNTEEYAKGLEFIYTNCQVDFRILEVPLRNIFRANKKFHDPERNLLGEFYNEDEDPNCYKIKDKCVVAIVCDWASGTVSAISVLKEIAKMNPDYFLHGGDVYNSGTYKEHKEKLVDPVKKYLPNARAFIVPGNHDLYAGTKGFKYSIKSFGQNASFFSLYNDHVQIDGHDTGFKDSDCFRTFFEHYPNTDLMDSEARWAKHRFQVAKDKRRKIVTLIHHMLVSPWIPAGNYEGLSSPVNHTLFDQLKEYIDDIDLCIMGHDHSVAIMEPYNYDGVTLHRPRLMGASSVHYRESGIENYESEKIATFEVGPFIPRPEVKPYFPGIVGSTINPTFMILKIDGDKIKATYYELPQSSIGVYESARPFYTEHIV